MNKKLESPHNIKATKVSKDTEPSLALNEQSEDFTKQLGISITLYRGQLNKKFRFLVGIAHEELTDVEVFEYCDLLSNCTKTTKQIDDYLKRYLGFRRTDFKKLQGIIEKLMEQQCFTKIDEATTIEYLNSASAMGDMKTAIEKSLSSDERAELEVEPAFEKTTKHILKNLLLFPIRDLSPSAPKDTGYVHGVSNGVYISDEDIIKEYGCELIGIKRDALKAILSQYSNEVYNKIINKFYQKGYFVKKVEWVMKAGEKPVHMYLIPVSVKEGVLRRD